jgi:hypothetical protein
MRALVQRLSGPRVTRYRLHPKPFPGDWTCVLQRRDLRRRCTLHRGRGQFFERMRMFASRRFASEG